MTKPLNKANRETNLSAVTFHAEHAAGLLMDIARYAQFDNWDDTEASHEMLQRHLAQLWVNINALGYSGDILGTDYEGTGPGQFNELEHS